VADHLNSAGDSAPDAAVPGNGKSDTDFDMLRREPEQPSLFPTEDLIIPETLRNLKKAVSAIHAIPAKAEHNQSLNSRRIFDGIIMAVQIDCRGRERKLIERIRSERISPMFEVRISDLARLSGIPGKNYQRIYAELDQLYEMSFKWNIVGEDAQVEWQMESHFLSVKGVGKGDKLGVIRFALDPSILEIILEPSRWASLSLQAREDLKTSASYALYQNAWRYVGTQAKVTAALPTSVWVELLIGKSRYVKEDPKHGKIVVNYSDFKRRVLLDAIERVNNSKALSYTLQLKEMRSGNRISKLQFKFIPKQQPSLGLPLTWPADLLNVLDNMGYLQRDIEDLAQAHSYEEVAEAIVRLKSAEGRMRGTGKTITAKKGYFEGILRNIAGGAVGDELDHDKIQAEVQQQEAQRAADAREERLKESFMDHQKKRFSAWLFELPEPERATLVAQFMGSPEATLPVRQFFDKGLSPGSMSALATLRVWLSKNRQDLAEQIFPNPEDKSFEAWMAWKLDNSEAP